MKNYVIDKDTARKKLGFVLGNSKEIEHYYLCENTRKNFETDVVTCFLYPQKTKKPISQIGQIALTQYCLEKDFSAYMKETDEKVIFPWKEVCEKLENSHFIGYGSNIIKNQASQNTQILSLFFQKQKTFLEIIIPEEWWIETEIDDNLTIYRETDSVYELSIGDCDFFRWENEWIRELKSFQLHTLSNTFCMEWMDQCGRYYAQSRGYAHHFISTVSLNFRSITDFELGKRGWNIIPTIKVLDKDGLFCEKKDHLITVQHLDHPDRNTRHGIENSFRVNIDLSKLNEEVDSIHVSVRLEPSDPSGRSFQENDMKEWNMEVFEERTGNVYVSKTVSKDQLLDRSEIPLVTLERTPTFWKAKME